MKRIMTIEGMSCETEDCMSKKDEFTVAHSKDIKSLFLVLTILALLFPVPFTLFQGKQHVILYIFSGGTAVLVGRFWLYLKVYKIIVDGCLIKVQKGLLKKFSLNVADIDELDWNISMLKIGKTDSATSTLITVRAGSRKFKVETLMEGSDEMIAYLKDNVDEGKIHTKITDSAKGTFYTQN